MLARRVLEAHVLLALPENELEAALDGLQNLNDLGLGESCFAHTKLLLPVWTRSLYLAMDLVYGNFTPLSFPLTIHNVTVMYPP